jgi:hypothetical protein
MVCVDVHCEIRPTPLIRLIGNILVGHWKRCTIQCVIFIVDNDRAVEEEVHARREVFFVLVESELGSVFLRQFQVLRSWCSADMCQGA